jgi:hypothetical protein
MKTRHLLIALSISTFIIANIPHSTILAQPNQSEETETLTTTTAQQVAAKITVRIQVGQSGGSGVIIGKKANTYLVLTMLTSSENHLASPSKHPTDKPTPPKKSKILKSVTSM